jgi:glycosyltransferase involved in cell wall biosynthesis
MHILVVSHYFWPEQFRINQLTTDLVDRGIRVTVLTGYPNYPEGDFFTGYGRPWPTVERQSAGYTILRVPVIKRGSGSSIRLFANYLSFILSAFFFGPFMLIGRKIDVQFVFCTTPPIQGFIALWFKVFTRAPVVQWVQDIWPESLATTGHIGMQSVLNMIGRSLSIMYSLSDLILGQSRSFQKMLRLRAPHTAVEYLPNPGERIGEITSVGIKLTGRFPIVFAGNIGRAQAISTILDAAEILRDDPDVHFSLFGVGSALDSFRKEVADRNLLNISFCGRVSSSEIYGVFEQASALLLTLTSSNAVSLTVPSKLQSYLASGKPILVSANGDAARIVSDAGAGLSSTAENGEALAMTIVEMKAMTRSQREVLGKNGRNYYEKNFSPDIVADNLVSILTRIVRCKG